MLELRIFAPCERAIIGDDQLVSMIAILEAVNLETNIDFPANAVFPMTWSVVSLWSRTEEVQSEVVYEQRVDVIRPDGETAGGSSTEFTVSNAYHNYRNISKFTNFPIGVTGDAAIKLFLREAGENNEWREIAKYPIRINHIRKEANVEEPTTENAEV
jgi:hypothetical protein